MENEMFTTQGGMVNPCVGIPKKEDVFMETITALIQDTPIPKMVKVRQKFDDSHIPAEEIPSIVTRELDRTPLGLSLPQRICASNLPLSKSGVATVMTEQPGRACVEILQI